MREPDIIGTNGHAWKQTKEELNKMAPEPHAGIGYWIIHAPWAHPFWSNYKLGLIHLREMPNIHGQLLIHMKGATHEILREAVDPDCQLSMDSPVAALRPANFAAQMIFHDDETAIDYMDETVAMIVNGQLNPDTDGRRQWVARFNDSMLVR